MRRDSAAALTYKNPSKILAGRHILLVAARGRA
jgi:hypothetical protein